MENPERTYISNALIIKYLQKKLSATESQEITEWLQQDEANCTFLFGLEELNQLYQWDEAKLAANTEKEWEKLEKIIRTHKQHTLHLPGMKSILKYAAVFIGILILSSAIFWQSRIIKELQAPFTITTAKGEHTQIVLPDGTKVWLNACSKITYTNAIFSKERQVTMSGEAYFEVTPNPEAPFIVHSKEISTRVLGTKFNIRAYDDEDCVIATLLQGSIQLTSSQNNFPKSIILKPGEKIICYESGKTKYINDPKNNETIDWISGKLHFENRPLETIVRELEKRFDTNFVFTSDSLKHECFTCDFENDETLHQILNILKLTNKFDYKKENLQIVLSPVSAN